MSSPILPSFPVQRMHAKIRSTSCRVGIATTGYFCLGGCASLVDTAAAYMLAFDERCLAASFGKGPGEGRTALTGADDERIIVG